MSKGIELSPKYGVNPCIPICFFCGEQKNEVAMLGRIRERDPITGKAVRGSDKEAPKSAVLDLQPCDKCAEKFKQGVLMIATTPDRQPTGAYAVMKSEAFNRVFDVEQHDGDTVFVEQSVLKQLQEQATNN